MFIDVHTDARCLRRYWASVCSHPLVVQAQTRDDGKEEAKTQIPNDDKKEPKVPNVETFGVYAPENPYVQNPTNPPE